MKGDPEQRAVQLGEYIAANRATVRAAAAVFGCSKSTVHKDVAVRLRTLQPELFRQVLASVLSGGKYGKEEAAARLAVLLVRLAEMAAEETEGVSAGMEKIQPAVEYLNAHFTRSTSTEELAGLCSLSPSRFLHLFTEEMGISPSRYKRGLRMQAAKELLRYGGQTVSEVADTLGYNDPLHFSRVFRKEAGIAPSRYRELFGKAGLQSGGFRGIMKETDAAEDGIFKTGAEFE